MVTNRCSSSEASSARVSAVGSNRTDSASENRIRCFRKLNFAFSGSQRVFTGQEYIYCMHMSRDFGSYVADIARRRRESAAAQKPEVARPEGSKSKIASEAKQPPEHRDIVVTPEVATAASAASQSPEVHLKPEGHGWNTKDPSPCLIKHGDGLLSQADHPSPFQRSRGRNGSAGSSKTAHEPQNIFPIARQCPL